MPTRPLPPCSLPSRRCIAAWDTGGRRRRSLRTCTGTDSPRPRRASGSAAASRRGGAAAGVHRHHGQGRGGGVVPSARIGIAYCDLFALLHLGTPRRPAPLLPLNPIL